MGPPPMTQPAATPEEMALANDSDRKAALECYLFIRSLPENDYRAVYAEASFMAGQRDGSKLVQAFARHRLAAIHAMENSD